MLVDARSDLNAKSRLIVLDMALLSGPDTQDEFCAALLNTLKQDGVVRIKNHGNPSETIYSLFDWVSDTIAPEKMEAPAYDSKLSVTNCSTYHMTTDGSKVFHYQRLQLCWSEKRCQPQFSPQNPGHQGECDQLVNEKLRVIAVPKETYGIGGPSDDLVSNVWIDESSLPGFQRFMEDFYKQAFETELHILCALAKGLGVSASHLQSLHSRAENMCRLVHYPATHAAAFKDGTATRIAAHTDFGTITMLFQDSTGGLQVEDPTDTGIFHDVESASPTDLVLNNGDSLQRLTNDTFRAASHRVTLPPSIRGANDNETIPERYSVAYLVKLNRDASLLPLKEFVKEAMPCRYDYITYREWNNLRYRNLYT